MTKGITKMSQHDVFKWKSEGRKPLVVVMGATGTGKTDLAVNLCKKFDGEAISADSMQGLDIATAKVTPAEAQGVPHHLLSFLAPHRTDFTVLQYRDAAIECMEELWQRGKLPVLVGGTAYYIEAVLFDILLTLPGTSHERDDSPSLSQWYAEGVPESLLSLDNSSLHAHLQSVDTKSARELHPNNRKRVLRALQVYYKQGVSKAELVAQQLQRDGASDKERRIRNRLLRVPGRELPPMYQLDVSDEAACTASTNAAVTLVENFLTGAAPAAEFSHLRLMADSADNLDSQQRIDWHSAKCIKCLHCDTILGSEFQWEKHVAGRNHRYRRGLAKRDGLNWDDLNPDGRSDFSDSEID